MAKVNKRLLPIKAHYFFFMAAMGPILPQLSVIGKQIGLSPETMGYITSVLPIMYVLAKPMFGFVADYFTSLRKFIFMSLIIVMTLAYCGFYFVPTAPSHLVILQDNAPEFSLSLLIAELLPCAVELRAPELLCSSTHFVHCNDENVNFTGLIVDVAINNSTQFNLTRNMNNDQHICLLPPLLQFSTNVTSFSGNCTVDASEHCIYGTFVFWLFVNMLFIGTIGFNVTNSISDAICFDMLGEAEGSKYGAQRVWGTIGFGFTAMLAGVFIDFWTLDTVKSFTPALFIMFIFSGLDLLSVSKLKLPKLSSSESILKDVWQLVIQPAIGVFLIFATIAGIIDSFIIYFMFWHVEEVAAETGYMDQIKLIEGLVVAAECLAGEVPFFFYSGKIIKKLGYVHCMSICFFSYAIRLALISWIPNPWYLVGVELFFQGITYALCYTCIVAYASNVAPPGTSATVQGLMAGMDDGLGFSVGSLIGGLMFKRFGGRRSFMYFAIGAMCTCVLHIIVRPTSRKRQSLPKSGYQVPTEQVTLSMNIKELTSESAAGNT